MPIVLVAMYLTIGLSFARGPATTTAANIFMPFSHLLIFGTFYILAMMNKYNREKHLRYIIISSVALFGPTIGRINFPYLSDFPGGFELLFIDIVLATFMFLDLSKKRDAKPFILGLSVYLFVHIGTQTFAYSVVW